MMLRSLRLRLLIVAIACILGTLAVAGSSLVVLFERQLLQRVGQELDARWAELGRSFIINAASAPEISPPLLDPRYHTPLSGAYWQVSEKGTPVLRSRSLWDGALDTSMAATHPDGQWFEVETADGRELYVVEREVILTGQDGLARHFRLAVALDHDEVTQARQAFGADVAKVLGLIALVLVLAAWVQLRLTLHPLKRLVQELRAIREGRLARFEAELPTEVAPLANDLNLLLDRQEQLVAKARERAGSLAHGLKTPLAILSAEARRLASEGNIGAAARVSEQAAAMRTHVERELARARTRGASAALGAYVDAQLTTERLIRAMARLPRGEEITWRCEIMAGLMLQMDPDDFGEVLGNLLDNARKWAKSTVTVRASSSDDTATIWIIDDGAGFVHSSSLSTLPKAYPQDSSGLGLVIVHDVLDSYGSELRVDHAAAHGAVSFKIATGGGARARASALGSPTKLEAILKMAAE